MQQSYVLINTNYAACFVFIELLCLSHIFMSPILEITLSKFLFKKKLSGETTQFAHGKIWEGSNCVGDQICIIRYVNNGQINIGKIMRCENDEIGNIISIKSCLGEVIRCEKSNPFGKTDARKHILFILYIWLVSELLLSFMLGILKNCLLLMFIMVMINLLLLPVLLVLRNKTW